MAKFHKNPNCSRMPFWQGCIEASEVEGINRVLYDLTPKPVGTIEWE